MIPGRSPPLERARAERFGLLVAVTVLACWLASVVGGVLLLRTSVAFVPLVVAVRALLNTGVFITAHDAMHGLVAPTRPALNDAIGALCLGLFAFLPYRRMRDAHHEHHRIPARAGDPDFVDGSFVRWFLGFFFGYVSAPIIVLNALLLIGLSLVGMPLPALLAVLVVPAFLSALQLFTFGTWLPHRPGADLVDDHRARSADVPPVLSFLACFHFGYHWEHHDEPWTPWWRLPARRAARRSALLAVPYEA